MPKVVLIGGSAGALSAFESFFEQLPDSCEHFALLFFSFASCAIRSRARLPGRRNPQMEVRDD